LRRLHRRLLVELIVLSLFNTIGLPGVIGFRANQGGDANRSGYY
jgi:hypothetical protein